MSSIREINPNPFHPLFAVIAKRTTDAKETRLYNDANSRVALVSYAERLLGEIANKHDKYITDYNADTERLRKTYNSISWFSWKLPGKLYTALNLWTSPNDFINLTDLNDETRQNIMFKDALELLNEAELIELENKYRTVKTTDSGKKHLAAEAKPIVEKEFEKLLPEGLINGVGTTIRNGKHGVIIMLTSEPPQDIKLPSSVKIEDLGCDMPVWVLPTGNWNLLPLLVPGQKKFDSDTQAKIDFWLRKNGQV